MGGQSPAHQERARREFTRRERRLRAISERQHGVVARRQLLGAGLSLRTIERRVERGQLHRLHRGVYAFHTKRVGRLGLSMAAVLACGDGATLSHRSAAALWRLLPSPRAVVEVSAPRGRGRPGIVVHEAALVADDLTASSGIPVTTVARTLFDVAELGDERQLENAFEEADRLSLLEIRALEAVCARGHGRRALKPIRHLITLAHEPGETRSPLEDRFLTFCKEHDLPEPQTNVLILGHEVDAYWPGARLMVESDSWSFHHHRAAFERDRTRDAAMQAQGYRVLRVTDRRLKNEANELAAELRVLLRSRGGRAGD